MNIEREQDVERLRQAALLLESENRKLSQRLINAELALLKANGRSPDELQLRLKEIEAQLQQRNKALFGPTSEKQPVKEKPTAEKQAQTGHGHREQLELPVETVMNRPGIPGGSVT